MFQFILILTRMFHLIHSPLMTRKPLLLDAEAEIRADERNHVLRELDREYQELRKRLKKGRRTRKSARRKTRKMVVRVPTPRKRRLREGSDQMKVYHLIQNRSGMRGAEIAQAVSPVNERTVRTALNRLKKHEFIEQRDGRWYPRKG